MPTLAEIRSQYPDYGDMTDGALADALHQKFYADMPRADFDVKIGLAGSSGSAPRSEPGMLTDEQVAIQQIEQSGPKPDRLAKRGDVLPLGRDKEGSLTGAVPSFLEGPRQAVMDLLDGRRTAQQITGKEIFELGMLFGGSAGGAANGTGAGVARASAERAATPAAERAATPVADSVAGSASAVAPEPVAPAGPPVAAAVVPETPSLANATLPEIKAASTAFYKAAEDAKVLISPKSYAPLAEDTFKVAAKNGLDPTLTPDSMAALKRIGELSDPKVGPVSFQTLDLMRQIASDAQAATRPSDRRIAGLIVDKIDDFIAGMTEKDVVSGNPEVAAKTIVKARDLWSTVRKLEEVERMVDRAQTSAPGFSGSGFENALRSEFRALAKNDRKLRTWAPDEQRAIKTIARGGPIANTARNLGKLAPTGVVSAVLSGGAGAAVGGPIGAVALPAGGFLARQVATILTRRNVKALETLIRERGGSDAVAAKLSRSRAVLQALEAPSRAPGAQGVEDLRK